MGIKQSIIRLIRFVSPINSKGSGNTISVGCKIRNGHVTVLGNSNLINIADSVKWHDAEININGDNNRLIIEPDVRLIGPCKIIMEGNATLHLKKNCGVRGVDFSIKDGCVEVGELAMFSYGIKVRNHDSHKVFDLGSSQPCNPPADIKIGKHVWICQDASILKGVEIGDDSIVAFGAVATKGCPPNSIIAGNPGKIVKTGITWDY